MTDKFEQFVRDMAALKTPDDPSELERRRELYAKEYDVPVETTTNEDAIEMITGDEEYEDARTFWEMICQARKLLETDQ